MVSWSTFGVTPSRAKLSVSLSTRAQRSRVSLLLATLEKNQKGPNLATLDTLCPFLERPQALSAHASAASLVTCHTSNANLKPVGRKLKLS